VVLEEVEEGVTEGAIDQLEMDEINQ